MPSSPVFTGRHRHILPENYTPGDDVIVIGRGRKVREHPGNIRFHAIVDSNLPAYKNAASKGQKTSILWRVLIQVRNQSENNLGFVKKDPETGLWCVVDDDTARINVAQAFRDRLASSYRSSKKYKSIKRQHDLGLIALKEGFRHEEITTSSLINSETDQKLQEARPSKRMCIPNQVPSAATETDVSVGRITKSPSIDRNFDILNQASKVTPCEPPKQVAATRSSEPPSSDTFYCLLNRFEMSVDCSGNPFDPKPIAVENHKPMATPSFEPMVMPLTASSCAFKESHQEQLEYEPLPLAKETAGTMLQSSLSFSSLDFVGFDIQYN